MTRQSSSVPMKAHRLTLVLLFCLSFFSNIYFLGSSGIGGYNAACRAALTVALVEHGTTSIDALQDLTDDKALLKGHRYCDKAPGMSFLALPVAEAFVATVNPSHDDALWHNHDKGPERGSIAFAALIGLSTVFTAGLLTAISVVVLCKIVMEFGGGIRCAVATALVYGQATPIWLWATGFYGHSAAAAMLVMGIHSVLRMRDGPARREARWALWCGMALGWSTLVEFTAAVPAVMLMVFVFFTSSGRALWRRLGLIVLGGLPELGLLLAYNAATFGSPFELGYLHSEVFNGMHTGFYGIGAPSLSVLLEITVGQERGLLLLSPVLALVPLGAVSAAVSPRWRALGALCILIVGYYFLLNSGFVYWDGGYSTGPRHVTAALPFACLLLAPLWERGGQLARRAIVILGAVSGLICLIAVAVDSAMPNDSDLTAAGYLLPRFWQGHFRGGLAFV